LANTSPHTLIHMKTEMNAQDSAPSERSDAYRLGFTDGVRDAKARRYHDQCPYYELRSPFRNEWREGYNAGFDSWPNK